MNEKIRKHLTDYNLREGYAVTDDALIETLRESDRVFEDPRGDHRWWTDVFVVAKVDGMLIGFMDAHTTGDNSPGDVGWEFDPENICEVVSKEITKTVYERVPNK